MLDGQRPSSTRLCLRQSISEVFLNSFYNPSKFSLLNQSERPISYFYHVVIAVFLSDQSKYHLDLLSEYKLS